jgi:hypothetical protein
VRRRTGWRRYVDQKRKRNHSTVDEDNECEVDKIFNTRISRGKLQYCVKWLRYDDDPTWYNTSNIKNSPCELRGFLLASFFPAKASQKVRDVDKVLEGRQRWGRPS